MCVQTAEKPWERPATKQDCAVLARYFPGIPEADLQAVFEAMSEDGGVPLATDLVLLGAVLSIDPDEFGIRSIPFTAVDLRTNTCVKIPEMDNIVEWMENSALGSHMWRKANEWLEQTYDCRVEFTMDCGCGIVPIEHFADGRYQQWIRRFNDERRTIYGRTNVERRDSIGGTTMSINERFMWEYIRTTLEALTTVDEAADQSLAA